MAEQQKVGVGTDATCKVKCGVQEIPMKLGGGKTVEQIRGSLKKVLNLTSDMQAYIGGELIAPGDEASTAVMADSTVEFVKAAGQKGLKVS